MKLGLQPGEKVRVRSRAEIIKTLNREGRNRGLVFTPEMLPFCGRQFTVARRIQKIIVESSGEMKKMNNTVTLEKGICDGRNVCGGCPRGAYLFWHEAWLERL